MELFCLNNYFPPQVELAARPWWLGKCIFMRFGLNKQGEWKTFNVTLVWGCLFFPDPLHSAMVQVEVWADDGLFGSSTFPVFDQSRLNGESKHASVLMKTWSSSLLVLGCYSTCPKAYIINMLHAWILMDQLRFKPAVCIFNHLRR